MSKVHAEARAAAAGAFCARVGCNQTQGACAVFVPICQNFCHCDRVGSTDAARRTLAARIKPVRAN